MVSARKYRPNNFEDVVGQSHVAETLMHEITQNKLAQAFLFTGPRGVGKTTCARILAKVINIQKGQPEQSDFAFNIFELDAASNNHVDDIRNLIDQVRIPPQVGQYKVYIIDEVHMLSTAAFNAFLKTLEEPPSYAIFILATTERHKILPTILSRCQVFNFKRIQVKDMVEHMRHIATQEEVEIGDEVLHLIAEKADGGLRDALSMFDQLVSFSSGQVSIEKAVEMLNVLDIKSFFDLLDFALAGDIKSSLLLVNNILRQGFDGSLIIGGFADHVRNLMVSLSKETLQLLDVADTVKDRYMEHSQKVDVAFLLNALDLLNQADSQYKMSRNPRLLIELTLMKLCHLNSFLNDLPNLEDLKKKLANTTVQATSSGATSPSKPINKHVPSIREDVSKKIKTTRLGDLNLDAFKRKKSQNAEVSEGSNSEQNIEFDHNSIDLESLREELIEGKTKRVSSTLKSVHLLIKDGKFFIEVGSKMQQHTIDEFRTEIIRSIKSRSKGKITNYEFRLNLQEVKSKKPYTDREKFEYLMEKHPSFAETVRLLKLNLPS